METQLDPTFLRPGLIARAAAVGLAAVGVGAGVLLACYGASFFVVPHSKRLDALTAKVEELARRPDRTGEVVAKLDDLRREAGKMGGGITEHLASIEGSIEKIKHRPIIPGNPTNDEKTVSGNVITTEVTVFRSVAHDNGSVVTGWTYPDGASADQRPTLQYCYWKSALFDGTTSLATIYIANDGVRLPNIGAGVPRLEDALKECVWWNSASN